MRRTFDIITLEWETVNSIKELPKQSGVYQCYGDSPIYGRNCLLYIGQALDIRERIKIHLSGNPLSHQNNTNFRFAILSEDRLTCTESILISTHKPSMNSDYINVPSETKKLVLIQNHGERGSLVLEVTNSHWIIDA